MAIVSIYVIILFIFLLNSNEITVKVIAIGIDSKAVKNIPLSVLFISPENTIS